jgi:hypothetical protein
MIGAARLKQLTRGLGMALGAGELMDDLTVPFETEPFEAINDRRNCPGGRALTVGIFDAQSKDTAVMSGE